MYPTECYLIICCYVNEGAPSQFFTFNNTKHPPLLLTVGNDDNTLQYY